MEKYLTKEGLEKLKKELHHLKTVKRKEISELIRHTASYGDLKENAAYDEAKDAQGFLEGRIRELEGVIANAKVIEGKNNGKVQIGSSVILESSEGRENFQIVGPEEADPLNGRISHLSPLGKVLISRSEGEKVKFQAPGGEVVYKIIKIE